jgi:hypothetical protein
MFFMAWEYITQGENPRIFERRYFGLFGLLLLLPSLIGWLVALLLLQDVWLHSFAIREMLLFVWSSGFVLLVCCSCGMKRCITKLSLLFACRGLLSRSVAEGGV